MNGRHLTNGQEERGRGRGNRQENEAGITWANREEKLKEKGLAWLAWEEGKGWKEKEKRRKLHLFFSDSVCGFRHLFGMADVPANTCLPLSPPPIYLTALSPPDPMPACLPSLYPADPAALGL